MVTVGGINNGTNATHECDWEYMGVAIFDLTLLGWGSVYDSGKAPYQVSAPISAVVGGGPDGGATKLFPDGGWTSTLVARLFTGSESQTAPYEPSGANSSGSSGSGNGSDTSDGGGGGPNVGAIVGGVVGGVAFLGAVIAVFSWWWRRKRSRGRRGGRVPVAGQAAEPDAPPPPPKSPVHELPSGQPEAAELEGDAGDAGVSPNTESPETPRGGHAGFF